MSDHLKIPKPVEDDSLFGLGRILRSDLFSKLIDAATALVLVTAALYFWGYVYYTACTERLGVNFHGISIPIQEYLVTSWLGVVYVLLVVAVGVVALGGLNWVLDIVIEKLRKKWPKKNPLEDTARLDHFQRCLNVGGAISVAVLVLFWGASLMAKEGQKDADRTLSRVTQVVVFAPDGKPIEGNFVYLRDYGSTLLVKEIDPKSRKPVGFRFFKESSYSGYSLVTREPQSVKEK